MRIAVLTFEGFNELDSFVASAMLNRVKRPELQALIVCPAQRVASMNGVVVQSQAPLSFAREADAVIVGSGRGTRDVVRDSGLMGELGLDPSRQIIGAQCSGALVLAKLGLLAECPGVHRFHDEAVGRGGRSPGPGPAVRRPRERRHGRRLPRLSLSRGVGDRSPRGLERGGKRRSLRRSRRPEAGICGRVLARWSSNTCQSTNPSRTSPADPVSNPRRAHCPQTLLRFDHDHPSRTTRPASRAPRAICELLFAVFQSGPPVVLTRGPSSPVRLRPILQKIRSVAETIRSSASSAVDARFVSFGPNGWVA